MKLRNKKTGKIGYLIACKDYERCSVVDNEWNTIGEYNSPTKLNEEWENYEEPKEQPDRLELDKQEILDKIKEIEDLVKNLR